MLPTLTRPDRPRTLAEQMVRLMSRQRDTRARSSWSSFAKIETGSSRRHTLEDYGFVAGRRADQFGELGGTGRGLARIACRTHL